MIQLMNSHNTTTQALPLSCWDVTQAGVLTPATCAFWYQDLLPILGGSAYFSYLKEVLSSNTPESAGKGSWEEWGERGAPGPMPRSSNFLPRQAWTVTWLVDFTQAQVKNHSSRPLRLCSFLVSPTVLPPARLPVPPVALPRSFL